MKDNVKWDAVEAYEVTPLIEKDRPGETIFRVACVLKFLSCQTDDGGLGADAIHGKQMLNETLAGILEHAQLEIDRYWSRND